MYKVLLVDDEEWILVSCREGIDWAGHGFTVSGTASNGMQALELVDKDPPDIILTDIRMPVMGGLELLKQIKTRYPHIEVIIISVYAEFAYAKRALTYGAAGYCLKPIDESELFVLLDEIRDKLDTRQAAHSDLFHMLDTLEDRGWQPDDLDNLAIPWNAEKGMRVVYVRADDLPDTLSEAYPHARIGINTWVCMVPDDHMSHLENIATQQILRIGISKILHSPRRLKSAMNQGRVAMMESFLDKEGRVAHYHSGDGSALDELASQILSKIRSYDGEAVRSQLSSLHPFFKAGGYNVNDIYYFYNRIYYALAADNDEALALSSAEEMVDTFGSFDEMIDALLDMIQERMDHRDRPAVLNVRNKVIDEVLQYIHQHLDQELTLKDISARVYLNSNYLCRVFKKEVGVPFGKYLTDLRMERACRLLRETALPVHEIAVKCGYNDYFYFARLFKKTLVMTPSTYRQQHSAS